MSDVNCVVIVGRVVEKPTVKFAESGTAVSNIRLANNVYMGKDKDEKVNWISVTVFGKQAENCEKYLDKGKQICVQGRLDHQSWDDKESGKKRSKIEVIANTVQFFGGKQDGQEPSAEHQPQFASPVDDTDDIPF